MIRFFTAALLFLALSATLFVGLTLWRMNDTILRAEYYAGPLQESGFYEFLMTDALLSALSESRIGDEPFLESLGVSDERLSASIYSLFPPQFVREEAEYILSNMGRYVMGETDGFTIIVSLNLDEDEVVSVLSSLLKDSDAYDLFHEELAIPVLDEALDGTMIADLGVSRERAHGAARNVLHREWFESQTNMLIGEIVPYLMGKKDGFNATGSLEDRVEAVLDESKALLKERDVYESVLAEIIASRVNIKMESDAAIAYGLVLTSEDVTSALRETVEPEWFHEQVERVVDDAKPFVLGRSDSFMSEVSLAEYKSRAAPVIRSVALQKLDETLASLPICGESIFPGYSENSLDCAPGEDDAGYQGRGAAVGRPSLRPECPGQDCVQSNVGKR